MIKKIISRLEAEINEFMKDVPDGDYLRGNVNFCAIAKEIVQEVAKEYDNGWIPVESELPKEHGKYIVTVKNLTGRDILPEPVFECAYIYGQFVFDGSYDNRVTAWRKKPAPYQKGEQYEAFSKNNDCYMAVRSSMDYAGMAD